MTNYYHTEKGRENILKAVKKYQNSEQGKEKRKEYFMSEVWKESHKKANKKYFQTEKGKEAQRRSNEKPASRERRRLWEQSEEGKIKRRAIRAKYNLKMKINKAKSKLAFADLYFVELFPLLFYGRVINAG